jgi:hypothetical protein
MARPPKPLQLNVEDFKELPAEVLKGLQAVFRVLNPYLSDVGSALSGSLSLTDNLLASVEESKTFRTTTSASDVVLRVKNRLPVRPKSVVVGALAPTADTTTITSAWSHTWKMNSNNEIEVRFQGLSNSTEYRVTLVVAA